MAKIFDFWSSNLRRQITDVRNVGLYIFAVIVLAVSWSGVRTIQTNYELQKKISVLKQQNSLLELYNGNTALRNQYYQTDQYLELAARQSLGLAAPGEQVLLVPEAVARKYVDPSLTPKSIQSAKTVDTRSKYIKNLEAWRDFLLGRKLFSD